MKLDLFDVTHVSAALLAAVACLRHRAYALGSACAVAALVDVAYVAGPSWDVHTLGAFVGPLSVVLVAMRLAACGWFALPAAVAIPALAIVAVASGPFLGSVGIAWLLVAAHAYAGTMGLVLLRLAPPTVERIHMRLVALFTATSAPGVVGHVCLALGYSMRPAAAMDVVFLILIMVCCVHPWITRYTCLQLSPPGSRSG